MACFTTWSTVADLFGVSSWKNVKFDPRYPVLIHICGVRQNTYGVCGRRKGRIHAVAKDALDVTEDISLSLGGVVFK